MIKKFLLLSTMCSSSFFVNAQLVIPDITFDGDGKVTSNWLSGGNNTISKLLLQADGKIIGVGTYKAPSGQFSKFVSLTRYNTNGSIDATYGTAGFVTPNPTSGNDMIDDAVLQPDGKAVVAGTGHDSLLLMRFNTDGTIDNTFDGDGIVQYGNGTTTSLISAMDIQPDGKFVVVGYQQNTTRDVVVFRFNVNGSIDAGFGTNGVATFDFNNANDVATSVLVDSVTGKIYVGTQKDSSGFADIILMRLNANGTIDNSFNETEC